MSIQITGRAGPAPDVDEATFRSVMASVCTPVAIVTTALDEAHPHGTTVSAFTSLSLRPPMVVVSLDRTSRTLTMIRIAGRFGLNVLGSDQSELARTFAGTAADRFAGTGWAMDGGLPRLAGAIGWLACDVDGITDGGDRVIVLGRVSAADSHEDGAPLTYHRRTFGTHTAHR